MTLLTTELGLKEAFGTLRMTFAGRQLPSRWALHALIAPRSATRITAQITLDATASIAVVAEKRNIMRLLIFVALSPPHYQLARRDEFLMNLTS